MVTYTTAIVNSRLQTVFSAVDGSSLPGQIVVYDTSNNALITFTLGVPSATIANRVATLTNAVATASLAGVPASAQLRNGLGNLVATLSIPGDIAITPTTISAGTLASLVGQITGN